MSCNAGELAESPFKKLTEFAFELECKVENDTVVFETPEKGEIPSKILPGVCEVSKPRSQPTTLENLAEFKPGIEITKQVCVINIDDT